VFAGDTGSLEHLLQAYTGSEQVLRPTQIRRGRPACLPSKALDEVLICEKQ
jgi:hypothetical protein